MRFLFILLTFLFPEKKILQQDIYVMIQDAEKSEAIPNEKAAFEKFKIINKKFPNNVHVLSKCSELCSRIGNREPSRESRDAFYQAAEIYAREALKVNPASDEGHVSLALVMGRRSLVKSGKEKIVMAREIKHHVDLALKYNPQNFKAWHILGKWNYEISKLTFAERAATKIFYGGLPAASLDDAIAAYEKARAISFTFLLNHLELAKAYKRNHELKKAIASLKQISSLPVQTEDDPRIKHEALTLLSEWD